MGRTIRLVKIDDFLWRSEDSSINLHLSHREWERPERRWYASWNTFMSGRVEHSGPTRAAVLKTLGARTHTIRSKP